MVNKTSGKPNIIGVITARGGSVRMPLKNIALLNGKPLVTYMIKAALGTKNLRRVIVSTDHPEISRISLEAGAEVPFVRPPKLSEDCPSEWVIQHAVEFAEKEEGRKVDIAVMMQPTTPLCLSADIDACIDLLLAHDEFDTVFSASPIRERPEWMFYREDSHKARLFIDGEVKGERGISQCLPGLIIPNGAVYALRRRALFEEGVQISKKTGVYVMPLERSVDIDEPLDMAFAEFLATRTPVSSKIERKD